MNHKIYEVGHDGFHWRLSQRHTHLSVPYSFKESAVLAARQLALASRPAQVVIRTPAGDVESELVFELEPAPARAVGSTALDALRVGR